MRPMFFAASSAFCSTPVLPYVTPSENSVSPSFGDQWVQPTAFQQQSSSPIVNDTVIKKILWIILSRFLISWLYIWGCQICEKCSRFIFFLWVCVGVIFTLTKFSHIHKYTCLSQIHIHVHWSYLYLYWCFGYHTKLEFMFSLSARHLLSEKKGINLYTRKLNIRKCILLMNIYF